MAKYESPCQVLGLFAGAILVSCGVIYILTLEANKRYGDSSDESYDNIERAGAPQVRQKRSLKFEIEGEQDDESERWMTWGGDKDPNDFMDWNVDSEGNFFMDIPLKQTEVKSNDEEFAQANKTEETNNETFVTDDTIDNYDDYDEKNTNYASDLSENLLTEGLKHRKIRNIEEKIEWLKNDDQIVAEIVRQFCPKPSTTTTTTTTIPSIQIDNNPDDTENDVGWHDVSNVVLFDEDANQEEVVEKENGQMKHLNHMRDVPPLLLQGNMNIGDPHVTWTNHDGMFNKGTSVDSHSDIKCESESEILLTVAITTMVNFLFFGFIMLTKNWICDSNQYGSSEDGTPFVNNDDYCADDGISTCNCMDENCPNSITPPYDRIAVPYKRFMNEPEQTRSVDVVGAAINSRGSVVSNVFYPPNLSVNSGDIVMSTTYPPHLQYPIDRLEASRTNSTNGFYNTNLIMQNNAPMQHHQMLDHALLNATQDFNKTNGQDLMEPSVVQWPTPKDIPNIQTNINFLAEHEPIII